MADITAMHETEISGTWIPEKMTDNSTPPKIASFANSHDPALLYAELLRKYTSNPSLLGLTLNPNSQWYATEITSGYFCQHDGFVSFVPGEKELINNRKKLTETLASFKDKYQRTDWKLPSVSSTITPAQKRALQDVINANKTSKNLLTSVLIENKKQGHAVEIYNTYCPILYHGIFQAAPHVHPYHLNEDGTSRIFKAGDAFINCLNYKNDSVLLYRPHAYLGSMAQLTADSYTSHPWVEWKVWANILYTDNKHDQSLKNYNAIIHEAAPALASPDNMQIGTFSELITKGPFVSHMTEPYDVKTLHILVDDPDKIPDTTEKLLTYLSNLPIVQQKFIIKQLFPFLTV